MGGDMNQLIWDEWGDSRCSLEQAGSARPPCVGAMRSHA
jgi:hypothetical protein